MGEGDDSKDGGTWAKWATVAAVLTGAILVFNFILKGKEVAQLTSKLTEEKPTASVSVRSVAREGGPSCLEFAFSNLPKEFALGEIELSIRQVEGPKPIAGEMAAEILERKVNAEITQGQLRLGRKISFAARIKSEEDNDLAYIDYCPVLSSIGVGATIYVAPEFLKPDGNPVTPIKVTLEDGASLQQGIILDISHPKNLSVQIQDDKELIIER